MSDPTPTPTPAPSPAPTTPPAGAGAAPDWTAGLEPEALGYVQNKQWKGPVDVLNSYRNLEKLTKVGADRLLQLPGDDNADAWGQVYDRLGRPKTPAEYGIKPPEKGGDPKLVEAATTKFHELGLSAKQAAGVAEFWNKYAGETVAQRDSAYQASVAEDTAKLKSEWGTKYDENVRLAQTAAKAFGIEAAEIDKLESALGFGKLIKMMHNIGSRVATEDTLVTGADGRQTGGFGMTKEAALSKRGELLKDSAFRARFASGDVAARSEMRRLDMVIAS